MEREPLESLNNKDETSSNTTLVCLGQEENCSHPLSLPASIPEEKTENADCEENFARPFSNSFKSQDVTPTDTATVNNDQQHDDSTQPDTANTGDSECRLSDAGKYAFAGLAANILAEFYGKNGEHQFRRKLLEDLMMSIELPEQSRLPQHAVANGEYKTEVDPLIDVLMEEKLVQKNPESLLTSLLLVAIKDGDYDARVRVIIEHMCWLLRVDISAVETVEDQLLSILKNQAQISEEEKKKAASDSKKKKIKRGILIGLATVVGGAVIGVTGGLAAPLIATGIGAIIGTAGGAALGSVAGVAVIGSLFGVAGAGLTGYKMKKRIGGIEQFEFDVLTEGSQMTVTIAVSGWVSEKGNEDFRTPWISLDNSKEQYYLKYEGQYLKELGQSLDYLYNMVVKQAITETLKYTALSTLLTAVAWPATLLGLASVIDNPWHVATQRAENTGKQLAEVLVNRQQGHRPVTLIGFSLGARVIFYCLKALAKHPRGAGVVENAYLLGAPVTGSPKEWEPLAGVIAGRIVNAYIKNDWMLKFLYRTASVQFKIAGTAPVMWDDRRMINMDLTNVVNGHMDYMKKMSTVLEAVGIKTRYVPNAFVPSSDSGYTSPAQSNNEISALISKNMSKDTLMAEPDAPVDFAQECFGDESVGPINVAYEKLQTQDSCDSVNHKPAEFELVMSGETTDSDKSLPERLTYDQLIEQGSSQDSMNESSQPVVRPKTKQIVQTACKPTCSEKLLGDVATKEKLLNTSNDNIITSDDDALSD